MARDSWPDKTSHGDFFRSFEARFRASKNQTALLQHIYGEYFKKYPWNCPHDAEPIPGHAYPEAINEEEKECSIKKTKEVEFKQTRHQPEEAREANDPGGAPSESALKSSKDPAPLFLSARRSSHIQVYLSLYYNSKIAPLLEKQAALDRASFAAAGKKWSKLVTRNKIVAELYMKETDDVIAAVEAERERLYQEELKARNSEDANWKAKVFKTMFPRLKATITKFCEETGVSASLFIGSPDPLLRISSYLRSMWELLMRERY
ncbi:hypothetical protein BS47DRAFT_1402560 [Hydnum rufescens UP504]|uniref:Uncharacterized protein n=1 Tax=Hydnum rufescens UP504 TaxID=1448309 RepID=A0A9P6ACQ7_9AGAM|nr:hypothetical protein BS47DRAFT_1402560 [Hydnum rufescens UP504]